MDVPNDIDATHSFLVGVMIAGGSECHCKRAGKL